MSTASFLATCRYTTRRTVTGQPCLRPTARNGTATVGLKPSGDRAKISRSSGGFMIFESLHEAMKRNELICVDGGVCRYHVNVDGHLTIYEILSYKKGAGQKMLRMLEEKRPFF